MRRLLHSERMAAYGPLACVDTKQSLRIILGDLCDKKVRARKGNL
jgi:hypothetical protein